MKTKTMSECEGLDKRSLHVSLGLNSREIFIVLGLV